MSTLSRALSHTNLPTFLTYATRTALDPSSTVYIGTHFEYTVQTSLRRLGFSLTRSGGAHDRGVDLYGVWRLPGVALPSSTPSSSSSSSFSSSTPSKARRIPIIISCKSTRNRGSAPSFLRELEGTLNKREPDTVGILAATIKSTAGARKHMVGSKVPLGYVFLEEGRVRQFVWNWAAVGVIGGDVGIAVKKGGEEEVVVLVGGEVVEDLVGGEEETEREEGEVEEGEVEEGEEREEGEEGEDHDEAESKPSHVSKSPQAENATTIRSS